MLDSVAEKCVGLGYSKCGLEPAFVTYFYFYHFLALIIFTMYNLQPLLIERMLILAIQLKYQKEKPTQENKQGFSFEWSGLFHFVHLLSFF